MKKTLKTLTPYVDTSVSQVSDDDLELINKFARAELKAEDVYTFKIRMCDGTEDRVSDEMSDDFLTEYAALVNTKSVPFLKDHCWSVDNQIGRVYKASVKTDENGVNYVEGWAYVPASDVELIEKIKTGVFKEVSVAFDGESVCSTCGEPMEKDYDGFGICKNGHKAGLDGCKSILTHCKDVFELSLVSVPCQPNAGIIKSLNISGEQPSPEEATLDTSKPTGGKKMKKGLLGLLKLKAFTKSAGEGDEQPTELVDVISDIEGAEEDLTDEDIQKLVEENAELKQKNQELQAKVDELQKKIEDAEAEAGKAAEEAEQAAVDTIVDAEVEKLMPLTPTVKENMLRDIDKKSLKLVDGKVEGLDEVMKSLTEKYAGLFGEKPATPKNSPDTLTVPTEPEKKNEGFRKGMTFTNKTSATPDNDAPRTVKKGFTFN